jgi:hypothetical protein
MRDFGFFIFAYTKNHRFSEIVNECRAVGKTCAEKLASGKQASRMPIALLLSSGKRY